MIPVSVIISVYIKDNAYFFDQALESIYVKQSHKPKEIILIEDGILDISLYKIIDKWKNLLGSKLKVIKIKENKGLANALNNGLRNCEYDLVARMDSDDIADPKRLFKQSEFMKKNKSVSVVGSFVKLIDKNGKQIGLRKNPLIISKSNFSSKLICPLNHPSVMFRKSDILNVDGYPNFRLCQDKALWSLLLLKNYKLSNIGEYLLSMRVENLNNRRSFYHFKFESKVIFYQWKIGFINILEFMIILSLSFVLRFSGPYFKNLYYFLRNKIQ